MDRDIIWEPFHFDFQTPKKEEDSSFKDEEENMLAGFEPPTFMDTPFGIYNMDDTMNPFKTFRFWMVHTNFKITEDVFNYLDNADGIESLTIISPYRCIVSIAKCFNINDVRAKIEHDLCDKHVALFLINTIQNKTLRSDVKVVYKEVRKKDFWIIYVFPNGTVSYLDFEEHSKFVEEFAVYKEVQNLSEGVLISSNDETNNKSRIQPGSSKS